MGLRLVIFTEDSGKSANDIVEALVRKSVAKVKEGVLSHRYDRVCAEGPSSRAYHGHAWKDRSRGARRTLVKDLARRLATGEFVVLHYDGDCPWSSGARSAHADEIEKLLREVCALANEERNLLQQVLHLVPHYSIEAWLYLNRAAVERNVSEPTRQSAIAWLDTERDEYGGYDRICRPKTHCPLTAKHNKALATDQWPADDALERSPSFRRTVEDWSRNASFTTALPTAESVEQEYV